jgi:molybdate-binding protein
MTETVNVLPHLRELQDAWRRQDFKFTKQQQEEYDLLIAARRERVRYFIDNGLVSKGGLRQKDQDN